MRVERETHAGGPAAWARRWASGGRFAPRLVTVLPLLPLFGCAPVVPSAVVPIVYDGSVEEPALTTWHDPSTGETVTAFRSESRWDGDGNVRCGASFRTGDAGTSTAAGNLRVEVVRVSPDERWSERTPFLIVADGQPLSMGRPVFEARGVKIGVEEALVAAVAPMALARCARAASCEVHVDGDAQVLSAASKSRLSEFLTRLTDR